MDLHQLRYLTAVVEEGSFTAAARREHVSQSGVSAQVQRLEREFGQPLLDRSGRRVSLTDLGRAVLPHVHQALRAIAEIHDAADEVAGLLRGSVTIGMITGCSIPAFMNALADVHAAHPGLTLSLVEGPSDELQRDVLAGALDLALVGYATEAEPGLHSAVVVDEPVVLAVRPDDPLALNDSAHLEALRQRTVISLTPGTGVRSAFDALRASLRSDIAVSLEASSPETVAGLAARGLGVAVLSKSMVAARGDLVAIAIADAEVHSQLGLVWPTQTHLTAATRAVRAAMVDALIPAPRPSAPE